MPGVGIGKKLAKVRPPRVHITYDLYLPDTSVGYQTKELPMVVGVLANFVGRGNKNFPRYRERNFVEINEKNFDKVMSRLEPEIEFQVRNKMGGNAPLNCVFKPKSMYDFSPAGIAQVVPELAELWKVRGMLKAAMGKLDGNEKAQEMILEALKGGQAASLITEAKAKPKAEPAADDEGGNA